MFHRFLLTNSFKRLTWFMSWLDRHIVRCLSSAFIDFLLRKTCWSRDTFTFKISMTRIKDTWCWKTWMQTDLIGTKWLLWRVSLKRNKSLNFFITRINLSDFEKFIGVLLDLRFTIGFLQPFASQHDRASQIINDWVSLGLIAAFRNPARVVKQYQTIDAENILEIARNVSLEFNCDFNTDGQLKSFIHINNACLTHCAAPWSNVKVNRAW